MTELNITIKQKHTHRHREQTYDCPGRGGVREGRPGSLGSVDANDYI